MKTNKSELINELIGSPDSFSEQKINTLLGIGAPPETSMLRRIFENKPDESELLNTNDIQQIITRIFDLNSVEKFGGAQDGALGFLNRRGQSIRNKRFFKTLAKNPQAIRILAEGDSWFEHPLIADTIDWILKLGQGKYAVHSLASGGDWLLNMIQEGKYLTEISTLGPEFLLLSGGGNDIVDDYKIGQLVQQGADYFNTKIAGSKHKYAKILLEEGHSVEDIKKLSCGLRFLTKDFFAYLWAFELQYKFLISRLGGKFPELRIITHGYDYAIPSCSRAPFYQLRQCLLNRTQNNGHWLKDAFIVKRIIDQSDQTATMFTMIYFINRTFTDICKDDLFPNVYHVDCRGLAKPEDWYDELHLKPGKFREVAQGFIQCIEMKDKNNRVVRLK